MIIWSQLGIVGYLAGPAAGGVIVGVAGFAGLALIPLAAAMALLTALRWSRPAQEAAPR